MSSIQINVLPVSTGIVNTTETELLVATSLNETNCIKNINLPCEGFNKSSIQCFGSSLPYDSTSFELVSDASNFEEAKEKLLLWSGLRAVPRCWDVIQPLLCSVYYPQCQNNQIHMPDRSLCTLTRTPCKIVDTEYGWPDFLQCHNNDVYGDDCPSRGDSFSFNKSTCEPPLIPTNNSASYYDEVDGCGLQCLNPLFNQAEHDEIHAFIAGWAAAACICTLFAMLSFFVDWKNSSKYPAKIIFYINVCFFLAGIGWLAQFFPGARDEIVCRKDGTKRLAEPLGTGESPSCLIVFMLVYYFLMAGIIWFDILSYSWFLMFKALGTYKDPLVGKEKWFHIIAWAIPCFLLIVCIAVSEVDGDSMSGICFVGYKNYSYRLGLLLIPVGVILLVGGFFIFRGLATLLSIKKGHPGLLSNNAVSKINWTMMRIGIFAVLAFASVFVTFAAHLYDYTNQALWEKSFREYIKCEANVTILEQLSGSKVQKCELESHPSLSILKLNLVALFGTGIVMSTWVWTKASALNWRRAWFKLIGRSDSEMKRIKRKSQIIAKAFAKKKSFKRTDKEHELGIQRLSDHTRTNSARFRSFRSNSNSSANMTGSGDVFGNGQTDCDEDAMEELEYSDHTMSHMDPVGIDYCLHSVSQEMSSTWIRNVPKIVERRGGILPEGKSSVRGSWDISRKPSLIRAREVTQVEPGLWAVSQYIDGDKMITKPRTARPTRKTAPAKGNLNEFFIGTSPYNFPHHPPRRLPPVVCHGDPSARLSSAVCHGDHKRRETCCHSHACPQHVGYPTDHYAIDPRMLYDPSLQHYHQGWSFPGCICPEESVPRSRNHSRPSTRASSRTNLDPSSTRSSLNLNFDEGRTCFCPQHPQASQCFVLPSDHSRVETRSMRKAKHKDTSKC